jgi:hypothetical protein
LNPTVHNLQYGAEFDLRFVGYSNPRLEMKDGRTCTCRYQDSYRCTYMRYEAFPCRFSFTVVVAPLEYVLIFLEY